jgi:isopentenyl diphosphate isomerase/L-lactate dehydrogenase-like FMN-dependent dehydrogenase
LGVFNNARRESFTNIWYNLLLYLISSVLLFLGPKFLQIYLATPVEILETIVPKAEQNGYRAIVITCDDPTYRLRDSIVPLFEEASKTIDPNLFQIMGRSNMHIPAVSNKPYLNHTPITWTNIERLRKLTTLPIICKGILSPIDAELAVKYGANGIIVRYLFS